MSIVNKLTVRAYEKFTVPIFKIINENGEIKEGLVHKIRMVKIEKSFWNPMRVKICKKL